MGLKTMRVIILVNRNPEVLDGVKRALEGAGASPNLFECRDWSTTDWQVHVEFPLPHPRHLNGILRAVDAVKGAAVMATAELPA